MFLVECFNGDYFFCSKIDVTETTIELTTRRGLLIIERQSINVKTS